MFLILKRQTLKLQIMKRVRFDSKALSKFDMAYLMGSWKFFPWTVMVDSFTYSEISSYFIEFCAVKGLSNRLG